MFDLIDKKKKVGFQSRILGKEKERPRISTMRRCRTCKINFEVNCSCSRSQPPNPPGINCRHEDYRAPPVVKYLVSVYNPRVIVYPFSSLDDASSLLEFYSNLTIHVNTNFLVA